MRKIFSMMLVAIMALSIMGCGNYDYDIVIDHAADLSGKYFVFSKSVWHTQDGDTKISMDAFIEVKKNGMGISVKLFENEDSKAVESVEFTYNELAGAVERYSVEGIPISRYTLNKGTFRVIFTIGKNNVYEAKPFIDYESEKASFHGIRDYKTTHDYVEIGGVKWATMNVGATTVAGSPETCFGDYFAWGEIEPYYGSKEWDDTEYTWLFDNWKPNPEGLEEADKGYEWPLYYGGKEFEFVEWSTPPYDDTKVLTSDFDVATVAWGSPWRMPTKDDFESLLEACTGSKAPMENAPLLSTANPTGGVYWLDSDQNYIEEYKGVAGVLFIDIEDTTKRVFFPTTGYASITSCWQIGLFCNYWSSSLFIEDPSEDPFTSYVLSLYYPKVHPATNALRVYGSPIRPVLDL